MTNYLEKLPDEIVDYIFVIKYKEQFKKVLNEINYKYLLSIDKDIVNKINKIWSAGEFEICWWKDIKENILNCNKDEMRITIGLEKKKGWLADMVKEKLNVTMFKKNKIDIWKIYNLENYYEKEEIKKYSLWYSSCIDMINGTLIYSSKANQRCKYTKDDLILILSNNGYLDGSVRVQDQLCEADYTRYMNGSTKINYYYKSWTKERLIKEINKVFNK